MAARERLDACDHALVPVRCRRACSAGRRFRPASRRPRRRERRRRMRGSRRPGRHAARPPSAARSSGARRPHGSRTGAARHRPIVATSQSRPRRPAGAHVEGEAPSAEQGERPRPGGSGPVRAGAMAQQPVGRRRAPPDDAEPGQHRHVVLGHRQVRDQADPVGPALSKNGCATAGAARSRPPERPAPRAP